MCDCVPVGLSGIVRDISFYSVSLEQPVLRKNWPVLSNAVMLLVSALVLRRRRHLSRQLL